MEDTIRVLYVADEPDPGKPPASSLGGEDDRFDLSTEIDVDAALDRVDSGEIDCVLSEHVPGGLSGLELLRRLREGHPDIPFVLLADERSEDAASEGLAAGATDYLCKGSGDGEGELLANRIGNLVERHRSRQELAERTRQLEALQENLPGIIYRCKNEPDWPMEYVGGEVEALCGYTAEAIESGEVSWGRDVVHPEDREELWETIGEKLAEDGTFETTYRIVRKDGDTRYVWEQGSAVDGDNPDTAERADHEGETAALEGFISDVTEQERRERERRRRADKITALHDVAAEMGGCETATAVYETVVDAAEDILEFDIAVADAGEGDRLVTEAASSKISDGQYYDETPIEAEDNLAAAAYRTGDSSIVSDIRKRDVAPADAAFRSALTVPVGDHGVFQAASRTVDAFDEDDLELVELLVAHAEARLEQLDRTRRLHRRTEQLQRQNERLDEFASIVSHDLRNPLSVAGGRLELAREECDSDHLGDAAVAIDRSEALIEDLLTLAREGGRTDDPEPVALDAVVEGCWLNVETVGATVRVETARTIRADRSRLRRLFENLFRNAVEHAGEEVTVTVGNLPDGEGFYVEDDGSGVPAAERDRVFETGYSTSRNGTGLGLAIVERIVEAHGWEIDVTAGDAGGARFEISSVERVE
ncbi:MAG: ATP-binding protein [Haloferacaceae archaeon]